MERNHVKLTTSILITITIGIALYIVWPRPLQSVMEPVELFSSTDCILTIIITVVWTVWLLSLLVVRLYYRLLKHRIFKV